MVIFGTYLYIRENWSKTTDSSGYRAYLKSNVAPAFDFKHWIGPYGQSKEAINQYILLNKEVTENILRKQELTRIVNRPGNPVIRWDANVLPTKEACEDRHAVDEISREELSQLTQAKEDRSFWDRWLNVRTAILPHGQESAVHEDGSLDMVFVSIFDGHAGSPAVSHLLSKVVHPVLANMIGLSTTQVSVCANGLSLSSSSHNHESAFMQTIKKTSVRYLWRIWNDNPTHGHSVSCKLTKTSSIHPLAWSNPLFPGRVKIPYFRSVLLISCLLKWSLSDLALSPRSSMSLAIKLYVANLGIRER